MMFPPRGMSSFRTLSRLICVAGGALVLFAAAQGASADVNTRVEVVPSFAALILGSTNGVATASNATTMTNAGAAWVVNQWAGRVVTMGGSTATVISNTDKVLTFVAWAPLAPTTGAYTITTNKQQDVEIWAKNIPTGSYGLGGYQFLLNTTAPVQILATCNGTFTSSTSVACNPHAQSFLGSTGRNVFCDTTIAPQQVAVQCGTLGPDTTVPGGIDGPTGSGLLATVRIRGAAVGTSSLALSNVLLLNPAVSVEYVFDGTVANGTRKVYPCPDLNGDGKVGLGDIVKLALIWNAAPGDPGWVADTNANGIADGVERDIDFSGRIGLGDVIMVTLVWNQFCV